MCIRDRYKGSLAFFSNLNPSVNKPMSLTSPVSYTHLRIYPFPLQSYAPHEEAHSTPWTLQCSVSVSYTHLDVYKRQLLKKCVPLCIRLGIMNKSYLICRNTILDQCFFQIIVDGKVLILSLIHISF